MTWPKAAFHKLEKTNLLQPSTDPTFTPIRKFIENLRDEHHESLEMGGLNGDGEVNSTQKTLQKNVGALHGMYLEFAKQHPSIFKKLQIYERWSFYGNSNNPTFQSILGPDMTGIGHSEFTGNVLVELCQQFNLDEYVKEFNTPFFNDKDNLSRLLAITAVFHDSSEIFTGDSISKTPEYRIGEIYRLGQIFDKLYTWTVSPRNTQQNSFIDSKQLKKHLQLIKSTFMIGLATRKDVHKVISGCQDPDCTSQRYIDFIDRNTLPFVRDWEGKKYKTDRDLQRDLQADMEKFYHDFKHWHDLTFLKVAMESAQNVVNHLGKNWDSVSIGDFMNNSVYRSVLAMCYSVLVTNSVLLLLRESRSMLSHYLISKGEYSKIITALFKLFDDSELGEETRMDLISIKLESQGLRIDLENPDFFEQRQKHNQNFYSTYDLWGQYSKTRIRVDQLPISSDQYNLHQYETKQVCTEIL